MITRTKYSQEEKLQIVNEFAKRNFVFQHPEYKRPTFLTGCRNTFLIQIR